jgi:hypothetical protein
LEDQLRKQISDLESRLSQTEKDKQNTEDKLTDDISLLHKSLLGKLSLNVLTFLINLFMNSQDLLTAAMK